LPFTLPELCHFNSADLLSEEFLISRQHLLASIHRL
jgi:hypothetical protein